MMQQKQKGRITELLVSIAFIFIIAGLLVLFTYQLSGKAKGERNNAYIRTTACIVTIPATTRTAEDIENCYKIVEEKTGIQLERNVHY